MSSLTNFKPPKGPSSHGSSIDGTSSNAGTIAVNLAGVLESVAAQMPSKGAIVGSNSSLSYSALVERVEKLAREIYAAGIDVGDRVAVILPNSIEFVVAAFAIWKRGAILVPLHARYQEQEILKYVMDCSVRAVITAARMSNIVQSIEQKHVGLEHAWFCGANSGEWKYVGTTAAQMQGHPGDIGGQVEADWPAITQYSTGSTGFSKRITRTHAQVLGEMRSVAAVMEITAEDRILGVAPFFHSYGLVNAMLCGLLSGATLYAVDDFFPRDVGRLVEREKITGFPGVPFMYQLLAEQRNKSDFTSLRYALSAGAPLPASTASAFASGYGKLIRQLYGSTETGVISIERGPGQPEYLSVGLPIPGVNVAVVDEFGHDVAADIDGQVAVTSPFASSGYDNLQSRSESYFKEGRFFPGDLGRLSVDGRLVLCGRKRGFINVAGNKVDPAEVETVLCEHEAISEAVVVGVSDGAAGEKLKAVLVTSAPFSRGDVLEYCRSKLADFKCPRIIEFRKEIPKSPLGKILRKYLIDEASAEKAKYFFDPQKGFTTTADESTENSAVDFPTLPPFLRVLLVTDGTVTKNLEAYLWEPIDVDLLLHVQQPSEQNYAELKVAAGDPIVKRRIVLRGRITGTSYACAEAIIVSDSFSPELKIMLVEKRMGIGELIRKFQYETYREVMWVERGQAGHWATYLNVEADADVATRCYTISHDGRPAIQIVEVFPIARYQSLS